MRIVILCVVLVSFTAGHVHSQAARILSPARNQEICLGDSLAVILQVSNPDTVARTILSLVRFTNVVPAASVYTRFDTLRDLPPGMSIERILPAYTTNPNILGHLGTFSACVESNALDDTNRIIADWPYRDSQCTRFFGIRTATLPSYNSMEKYDKTASINIPEPAKWVSIGAEVVEGEHETWDPPPERYEKPVGKDSLYSPVARIDRSDFNGQYYAGTDVGDTLVSFAYNLSGQSLMAVTFDFMRSGKYLYPTLWDARTMIGPEHTVVDSSGKTIRAADSLVIEFRDPDEPACNPQKWLPIVAIPGGRDFEFQNFWIYIDNVASTATLRITGEPTRTIPLDRNYLNSRFRFRLRLQASDHGNAMTNDDDDPWYIDNISLQVPRKPEHEVMWTRVVTPYAITPHAATSALHVYCKVKNNQRDAAVAIPLRVVIEDTQENVVYEQTMNLILPAGLDSLIRMPDWNAQSAVGTKFTVRGYLPTNSFAESHTNDNETYSIFYLNGGQDTISVQEFAYDDGTNDIPLLSAVIDGGIGFEGTSGSYAMKFTLTQKDTVKGARIYFARNNSAMDAIRLSLLWGDSSSCTPGDTFLTFIHMRTPPFNEFTPYLFPAPIQLPAGTYWLSVSQLSIDNYMIGGDISRGGAQIVVADSLSPVIAPIYASPYGTQTSPWENTGDIRCRYAVEVPAGSGQWSPWMPDSGWWPAHTGSSIPQAIKLDLQMTAPFIGAGTYLPMIRPIVGSNSGPTLVVHRGDSKTTFQNRPNPFKPSAGPTELHFTLEENAEVTVTIFDALGREVRLLATSRFARGAHSIRWDGKTANAKFVLPGMYFCRLETAKHMQVCKMTVVE